MKHFSCHRWSDPFFACNTEEFQHKILGYSKRFGIKFVFVLIGVNAENKSWGKDDVFIITYILNVSVNVFPVN